MIQLECMETFKYAQTHEDYYKILNTKIQSGRELYLSAREVENSKIFLITPVESEYHIKAAEPPDILMGIKEKSNQCRLLCNPS